jgi:hypothetical protein
MARRRDLGVQTSAFRRGFAILQLDAPNHAECSHKNNMCMLCRK